MIERKSSILLRSILGAAEEGCQGGLPSKAWDRMTSAPWSFLGSRVNHRATQQADPKCGPFFGQEEAQWLVLDDAGPVPWDGLNQVAGGQKLLHEIT